MTTPTTFRQSKETQTDPDLHLLEFSDAVTGVFERAVLNNEDVIFESNTYTRANFAAHAPAEGDVFRAPSLTFSNVSRAPGIAALNAGDRIGCRLIVLDGSDYTISGGVRTYYSTLIDTKSMMIISDVSADVISITGTLGPRMSLDLPYPISASRKRAFPGAHM